MFRSRKKTNESSEQDYGIACEESQRTGEGIGIIIDRLRVSRSLVSLPSNATEQVASLEEELQQAKRRLEEEQQRQYAILQEYEQMFARGKSLAKEIEMGEIRLEGAKNSLRTADEQFDRDFCNPTAMDTSRAVIVVVEGLKVLIERGNALVTKKRDELKTHRAAQAAFVAKHKLQLNDDGSLRYTEPEEFSPLGSSTTHRI
jgi:hypothetical protein